MKFRPELQKGREVSQKIRTVSPCVCSSAVFDSLILLPVQYILGTKMKRKEADYFLNISVFGFLCYTAVVFHRIMGDNKSLKVSRTLESILADIDNGFDSPSDLQLPLSLLETVPSSPTTIGITVTFIFDSLFSSLARSKHLFIFSLSYIFTQSSTETAKSSRFFYSC